jgi:tRNA/rRNA methyltransferase
MGYSADENPYRVFHSSCGERRKNVHIVLVRPEQGGNVGSTCRALANMGIEGSLRIVGTRQILNGECEKMAKHASDRLEGIRFFPSLEAALESDPNKPKLSLAATARIGSPNRPHPLWAREAVERATARLVSGSISDLFFVFGPESSGLTNEEVGLCDWVVTIPSVTRYRSLNLSQAVLVLAYEANICLLDKAKKFEAERPGQKEKLVDHLLLMAREVGFLHEGDPYKMRPRLEEILNHMPNSLEDAKTIHGLIDQIVRSVKKGEVDLKGRFK